MTPKNLLDMTDLIRGYEKSQVGCALASLSIADHLAEGPASLARLVENTGAHPDALKRLIRGAASIGLVRCEFRFNPAGVSDLKPAAIPK